MSRAQLRQTIAVLGDDSEVIPVQNARVNVYRTGTTDTPVMFADPVGGSALPNPLLSGDDGLLVVWLDESEAGTVLDVVVDDNTNTAYRAGQPSELLDFAAFSELELLATPPEDQVAAGGSVTALWLGTETEYAAIDPVSPTTVYVVTEDP